MIPQMPYKDKNKRKEYEDIGDEEVMWIHFHKGVEHKKGYYFKRK